MTVQGKDGETPGITPDLGGAAGGRTKRIGPDDLPKERIYVAGPMTGIPRFNIPAFDAAAFVLRKQGFDVTSPAELDDPETRKAAFASPDGAPGSGASNGETWEDFLRRDIDIVRNIEGIVVLPGWENSKGATFEVDTANKLACWVRPFDPETGDVGKVIPREELYRKCSAKWASVFNVDPLAQARTTARAELLELGLAGEKRIVDPATGGAKGQKDARYDLMPFAALREIALVYGMGARKYDDDNWRKGYAWRLSLGAMMRHIDQFAVGEIYDEESGLHHLAHAAWHCLCLITFQQFDLGTNDIWEHNQ